MKTSTKDLSKDISMAWQISLLMLLCAVLIMLPDLSYAQTAANSTDTVVGNTLCRVVGWFTGNTGKGIATIAIIVIGVGALMGKVSWGMAITLGTGIGVVFGSWGIVNGLADLGNVDCSVDGGDDPA